MPTLVEPVELPLLLLLLLLELLELLLLVFKLPVGPFIFALPINLGFAFGKITFGFGPKCPFWFGIWFE